MGDHAENQNNSQKIVKKTPPKHEETQADCGLSPVQKLDTTPQSALLFPRHLSQTHTAKQPLTTYINLGDPGEESSSYPNNFLEDDTGFIIVS